MMSQPLYEGDIRRCRRCKRRRMDDEPPEVQQYKTCAKCRIIERTKKKSRKPLAEETMRYGMRQFQEQSQNSNFIHDEIFANDQLLGEMQAAAHDAALHKPYPSQYGVYKSPQSSFTNVAPASQPDAASYSYLYGGSAPYAPASVSRPTSAPSGASPQFNSPQMAQQSPQNQASAAAPQPSAANSAPYTNATSSAAAAAIAAAAIKRTDASLGGAQSLSRSHSHYRQYQQKQQGGERRDAATQCELCSSSLDAEDSMSAMYRLCRSCYSDPYARPHVYSDFNEFLLAVVRDKDAAHVTYVSELAAYLVESLGSNRAIGSEQQFRKVMMDAFGSIYVDPLVGSLAPLAFSRAAHNAHEVNNTAPIVSKVSQQYHYTLTPPLRIKYVAEAGGATTTIEMTFITETNLIIMRKTTSKASQAYDTSFLRSLDEQMRAKGHTFDEDPATVYGHLDISISKDQFVKDFQSLQKQIADVRATESEAAEDAETFEPNGAGSEQKPASGLEAKDAPNGADLDAESVASDQAKADDAADDEHGEETDQSASKETQEPGELDPAFAS